MVRAKENVMAVVDEAMTADLNARQSIPAQDSVVDTVSTSSSTPADILSASFSYQLPDQRMADAGIPIDFPLE
jgi:hypothetical protein